MYKTIVLALLQQHPKFHDQLRSKRTLLATLNLYASQLKTNHEAWQDYLSRTRPGTSERQIASQALEFAIKALEACLAPPSPPQATEPLSLDGAMAFIRGRTPPA